jgi:hypothetical protein
MGILSWLFGSSAKPHPDYEEGIDDDWDDDDDDYGTVNGPADIQNHGGGKYTSRGGNNYERFRPANDIDKRGSYKIDQTFEVAGAFAFSNEINAICNWLGSAGDKVHVKVFVEREPTNQYDANAIKLSLQGDGLAQTTFGYLPKDIAAQYTDELPIVELESIYQRREIIARTLIKRAKAKK